jgi:hypothetical protein
LTQIAAAYLRGNSADAKAQLQNFLSTPSTLGSPPLAGALIGAFAGFPLCALDSDSALRRRLRYYARLYSAGSARTGCRSSLRYF